MKQPTRARLAEPEAVSLGSEIMTVQDVADYVSCHYYTIYRLVHRGALPVLRMGRQYRFRRADIDRWIQQRERPEESPLPKGARGRGRPRTP
jgi:excisionase family DNA binding protein